MSLFLKKARYKNGKTFLSIVDGFRVDKKVKQVVVKKLGYLEDLKKIYKDPISHFENEVQKMKIENKISLPENINPNETIDENEHELNVGYIILKKIYEELNLPEFFKSKQSNLKINYDLNKVFSLLVFSRILFPSSKFKTYENKDLFFEPFNFSKDDVYRSLDYFNSYKEEIQTLLWKHTKDKYKRDTSSCYYDCTNYYFEIEYNDDDIYEYDEHNNVKLDKDGNPIVLKKGLRKRGPEKNKRPDPIVEMGLLMDASGIPLSYDLFPGNESEKLSLRPILNRTQNSFDIGRTIVVADRGLNTSDNIVLIAGTSIEESLKRNGYVYGQSVRGADEEFKQWVLSGNYKTDIIKDGDDEIKFVHKSRVYPKKMSVTRYDKGLTKSGNLKKQTITVDQKQMVYFSQKYADKQKRDRQKMIEKAKDLIKNPSNYTKATSYGAAGYVNNIAFSKSTGEVIEKDLSLNEDKIKEEEKYDGYYSIVTSEEHLSDIEIRNIYRGLSKIEETFKVTKSNLNARPAFVWTEEHIQAHFLTCFVSLVILRLLERKLEYKYSINDIIDSLKKYKCYSDFSNIYRFVYIDDIIKDSEKIFSIDLSKKRLSRKKIKNLLKY